MDRYEGKVAEGLGANQIIKDNSGGLMRDFVVLIRQTKLDLKTGKFLTEYQNINVLVGGSTNVDKVKPEVETFISSFGGSFTSEWKIHK